MYIPCIQLNSSSQTDQRIFWTGGTAREKTWRIWHEKVCNMLLTIMKNSLSLQSFFWYHKRKLDISFNHIQTIQKHISFCHKIWSIRYNPYGVVDIISSHIDKFIMRSMCRWGCLRISSYVNREVLPEFSLWNT